MLRLFDVDVRIGRPTVAFHGCDEAQAFTIQDLVSEMDRLSIGKALVRHMAGKEADADFGNDHLFEESPVSDRLFPCVAGTPDRCGVVADAERTVDDLIARGARAMVLYPSSQSFRLKPWCVGPLLETLQSRRLPLLLDFDEINADDLDQVLCVFPGLRVILLAITYRVNRMLYPLLARHPGLHLCISPPYSVHLGLEEVAGRSGAQRLLFGSGWPEREPGASITYLLYSGLDEEEKAEIGHGNAERLLGPLPKDDAMSPEGIIDE